MDVHPGELFGAVEALPIVVGEHAEEEGGEELALADAHVEGEGDGADEADGEGEAFFGGAEGGFADAAAVHGDDGEEVQGAPEDADEEEAADGEAEEGGLDVEGGGGEPDEETGADLEGGAGGADEDLFASGAPGGADGEAAEGVEDDFGAAFAEAAHDEGVTEFMDEDGEEDHGDPDGDALHLAGGAGGEGAAEEGGIQPEEPVDADGEAEEGEVQHGREFGYAWKEGWSK